MNKALTKYKALPIQVRASLWFLICSFLQKGISMITTPIFTRIMSTSDYGQFGVFNSWLGIITILVSMNFYAGVHAQGIVKFSNERNQFTSSLQGLTTILVMSWTVVYFAAHEFWNDLLSLTTLQMLSMMLIIWMTAIFNFWANEQRVVYSYRTLVIVTVLVSIVRPALEIVLVTHSSDKVTARILGWVIVEIIAYLWMYVLQLKKGGIFYSQKYWKYAIVFNLPLIPHYLSQTVLNSADRIMINEMVGSSESGIYNLAYSVSLIMTLFNTALAQTISPWIYNKIKEKKENDIAPIAYGTLILIAMVNLLLILLAPEVVAIFAPKSYFDAIWVIPPVAMSVYFMYSYDLFAKFAFYYEKTKIIMFASIFGAALNVGLNYVFIKMFGYIAAGYTTLVCYIVYAIAHYIIMKKVCDKYCEKKYPYNTKTILKITVPFLIIGFVFLGTYLYPIIRYSFVLAAVIIVVIKRKKIISYLKTLFMLRKAES